MRRSGDPGRVNGCGPADLVCQDWAEKGRHLNGKVLIHLVDDVGVLGWRDPLPLRRDPPPSPTPANLRGPRS